MSEKRTIYNIYDVIVIDPENVEVVAAEKVVSNSNEDIECVVRTQIPPDYIVRIKLVESFDLPKNKE